MCLPARRNGHGGNASSRELVVIGKLLLGSFFLTQRTHPAGQLSRSVAKRGRTDRSRKSRTTWTSGSCAGASRDSRDASADQDPSVSRACDTAVAGLRETRNALRTETNLVTNGFIATVPKKLLPGDSSVDGTNRKHTLILCDSHQPQSGRRIWAQEQRHRCAQEETENRMGRRKCGIRALIPSSGTTRSDANSATAASTFLGRNWAARMRHASVDDMGGAKRSSDAQMLSLPVAACCRSFFATRQRRLSLWNQCVAVSIPSVLSSQGRPQFVESARRRRLQGASYATVHPRRH